MKKVVKVSIGNLAFTIEEDGYSLVKRYLDDIKNHYYTDESGNEIIDGIEERMAELIMERVGVDAVVSLAVIQEVITILGKPADFDEADTKNRPKMKRKLYRDGTNRVLGGVCSGLAAYFNLDAVLVRIVFIILFLLCSSIGWFSFRNIGFVHIPSAGFFIFVYIALWIIIPKARTLEQRHAMFGESVDLSNIQERVKSGAQSINMGVQNVGREGSRVLSGLGRLIAGIIGTIFIIVSITGLAILFFLFLGVEIIHGVLPLEVFDYIQFGVDNALWIKATIIVTTILPLIGILYAGIQMAFGFKSPRWRPGLTIFLIWIVASISLFALSAKASRPYWNHSEYSEEIAMAQVPDTLYIDMKSQEPMPETKVFLEAGRREYSIFWIDGPRRERKISVYPSVRIIRQSPENPEMEGKMVIKSYAFSRSYANASTKAERANPSFSLTDSLMVIHPKVYDRDKKWDFTYNRITLYLPDCTEVIVREPVKHDFRERIKWHWSDSWWW